MTLAAVFNKRDQAAGTEPGALDNLGGASSTLGDASLRTTSNVSPAAGVVVTARTGQLGAGGYVTASVLGTGANADILTQVKEAV